MEQKTLRYVVITVGTVGILMILTVVLGLVFFAPRNGDPWRMAAGSTAAPRTARSPASADTGEWTRYESDRPNLIPSQESSPADSSAAEGSTAAVAGGNAGADDSAARSNPNALDSARGTNTATSTSGNVIFIYGEAPKEGATSAEVVTREDGSTVIDLNGAPRPERPSIKPAAETAQAETASKPVVTGPAATATSEAARSAKPVAGKPVVAKPAATKQVAKTEAPPTKLVEQFFIQAGAYSTKAGADAIKAKLAEKKINALVQIREVDGKTFFRVRVGPYNTKSEAEYWLSLIKTFEGFGESYVSMTKVLR